MPKLSPQPETFIKHRGFFKYSELLQATRNWFVEDDFDILNIPIEKQKFPAPTGVEHELTIKGEKNVTDYVKFYIDIRMVFFNMRDIEVVHEGKKTQMQDAQVQIEIMPKVEFDWQKRFAGLGPWKGIMEQLDNFYRKYIIKYKIDDYWEDMVLLKATQLAKVIRETLGQEVM